MRLKSKQYFYYDIWYEKGICTFTDLLYLDIITTVLKSFDDLIILKFDIIGRSTILLLKAFL